MKYNKVLTTTPECFNKCCLQQDFLFSLILVLLLFHPYSNNRSLMWRNSTRTCKTSTRGKEKVMEKLETTKYIRRGVFLYTSNMCVNFWQMMRRNCMRSSKSIPPSSLDIISSWKEQYMRETDSRKDQCWKLFGPLVLQV
jgi:hypothetical protein